MSDQFVRSIKLPQASITDAYPYSIPAVKNIESLQFDAPVTFLVGENGSGKSTIIEAIAVAAGFNAEGGTKNYNFSTQDTSSELSNSITLVRGAKRERYGYFLRAESFYTAANYAETGTELMNGPSPIYFDGKRIHEQSHGEAFMAIVKEFRPGLFVFDEPESALSPQRLLRLMSYIHGLVKQGAQFIIATHSPVLLAFPEAVIYQLSENGVARVGYSDVEHVELTRAFLNSPDTFLNKLFDEGE